MNIGNNLQDDLANKEALKVKRMREAHEQRRLRILNAKQRIIGLDIEALDAQVAEKKKNAADRKEIENYERNQALEIERLLAAADEEERQMKLFQTREIKKSWENAIDLRKTAKNTPSAVPDFDPDNSGPASLQKFSGEDTDRINRIRAQKSQMKRWIQEQMAEKAYQRKLTKEEDAQYAELVKAVDDIRETTEREEQELRKYIQLSVKESNRELAERQRDKNKTSIHDFAPTSLDCFTEDKCLAMNDRGRIIRADMFKGFTREQLQKIYEENNDIIRQKRESAAFNKAHENDWILQQAMALRAMEMAEYEEKQMKEAQNEERLAYLRGQIEEQRKFKDEWNKTKYGKIEKGFFDGFGTSCR